MVEFADFKDNGGDKNYGNLQGFPGSLAAQASQHKYEIPLFGCPRKLVNG